MTETTYSFVYDQKAADSALPAIATNQLVLSLLAGLVPDAEWEGCLVYEGESPLDPGTVCIGTRGPGADLLQLRLLRNFERQGIGAIEVFEGGPEVRTPIAEVAAGQWVTPSR